MAEQKIDPNLLAALKAQIKAELEAEAAEREKMKKPAKKEMTESQKKNRAKLEERVPIFLFKDGKDYKDDVFVSVNGRAIAIKRGMTVMVKRKYANVLNQAQKQQIVANEYAQKMQEEFRNESRKYN